MEPTTGCRATVLVLLLDAVVLGGCRGKAAAKAPEEAIAGYCQLLFDWNAAVDSDELGGPLNAVARSALGQKAPPLDAYPGAIEGWRRLQRRARDIAVPTQLDGSHRELVAASDDAVGLVTETYAVFQQAKAGKLDPQAAIAQMNDIYTKRKTWSRNFIAAVDSLCLELGKLPDDVRLRVGWECYRDGPIAQKLRRTTSSSASSSTKKRSAFSGQVSLTKRDGRPYAKANYTFCLSATSQHLEYVKAEVTNLSAEWLNALLYAPELRVTWSKQPGPETRSRRFVSTIVSAAKDGKNISPETITVKPGEARTFVYWYSGLQDNADFHRRVGVVLGKPNPPDADVWSADGLSELVILPNGEGAIDPRYPLPEGHWEPSPSPMRLTEFAAESPSACDVVGEDPYAESGSVSATAPPPSRDTQAVPEQFTVVVKSDPPGAEVRASYMSGLRQGTMPMGKTPLELRLSASDKAWTLVLHLDGYQDQELKFVPRTPEVFEVRMVPDRPAAGTSEVTAEPVMARTVTLNTEGRPTFLESESCPDGGNWLSVQLAGGIISYQCEEGHDVQHGPERVVTDKGLVLSEKYFVHGTLDGACRTWWDNGQPKMAGRYAGGKKVGAWFEWDRTGKLTKKTNTEK